MKHSKHTKLVKPITGAYGFNEIAILGTTCEKINEIAHAIISQLGKNLNIAYIDADHSQENAEISHTKLQDKINQLQINTRNRSSVLQKTTLNSENLVLLNGNHFQSRKQIICIDSKKESSLQKRKEQITDVLAIIIFEPEAEPYPWLKNHLDEISVDKIPVFGFSENEALGVNIKNSLQKPPLKALILKGGKSQRMGEDKSRLAYHGVPQEEYLKNIFLEMGIEAFVSESQSTNTENTIIDTFTGLGPYGGILSAFREDPNSAWLVIACDLPLIGLKEIQHLVNHRNIYKSATACYNPETDFPDPLFTIWEPRAYSILLHYLSQGYSCPRKVLINEDIELVQLENPGILRNCNTPEERAEVMKLITNTSKQRLFRDFFR